MSKIIVFRVILLFLFASIAIVYLTYRNKALALNQDFKGIVERVRYYGGKMDAIVLLDDGNEYELNYYSIKKEQNVTKNDSLVKFKGKLTLYHYKKNNFGKYYLYQTYTWNSFFGN